jgi:hypothetical protein
MTVASDFQWKMLGQVLRPKRVTGVLFDRYVLDFTNRG